MSGSQSKRLGSLGDIAQEYTEKAFRTLLDETYREACRRLGVTDRASSPYKELGLDPSAPPELVESAWRWWANRCHPDKGGNKQEFIRKRAAYEAIKNAGG